MKSARAGIEFREQLDQLRRGFARLRGLATDRRRSGCGGVSGGANSRRRAFRAINGSSAAATCCFADSTSPPAALAANEFLQSTGSGLDRLGADVPRHALERVRETLGERDITCGERGSDLPDRRTLLLDELTQEFQIQLSISRDAGQAVFRVQPGDGPAGRPLVGALTFRPLRLDRRRSSGWTRRFVEPPHRLEQVVRINRLGDVVVHAGGETTLLLLHRRVRGHGDDRQRGEARVRTELGRGLITVHHRHLQIHQHHVERRRLWTVGQNLHRLASVVGDRHRRARAFEQFDGDLLVDVVVLGQKNPRAAQAHGLLAFRRGTGSLALLREHIDERVHDHGLGDGLDEETIQLQSLGFLADFFAPERSDEHDAPADASTFHRS